MKDCFSFLCFLRCAPTHTEPHMLKRRLPRNSLRLVSPLLDNLWSNTLALANYSTYMNAYEHIQRVNAVLRRNLHGYDFISSERLYSCVSFMNNWKSCAKFNLCWKFNDETETRNDKPYLPPVVGKLLGWGWRPKRNKWHLSASSGC